MRALNWGVEGGVFLRLGTSMGAEGRGTRITLHVRSCVWRVCMAMLSISGTMIWHHVESFFESAFPIHL